MIPRHVIDQVIDAASIEEVIGEYVDMKKRGANFVGLCPFHNEKTPSFSVSPNKGIYKCFGCGQSGNSVKFLMEHEQLSFIDAIRMLAGKYNIPIEERPETEEEILSRDKKESFHIINGFAQKFFSSQLLESEEGKSVGLSYFKERGFRKATVDKFLLGYNAKSGTAFAGHALQNKHSKEHLLELGLVSDKGGQLADFFRERVIFPIQNLSGKVIGFAGRTLKEDKRIPKYVNSPESIVYNKSKILYGLYQARHAIKQNDNCLLVEGYTDVLSMSQAGIEHVVASSGTSLTRDQVKLISKFTSNITMLYDGDEAGIKAALRGMRIVLEAGLNVRILVFPGQEDPDSFIKRVGSVEFLKFVENNTQDLIAFQTEVLTKSNRNDPAGTTAVIREIVDTIALIPDPLKRQLFVKECSKQVDVDEQILISEINKIIRARLKKKITVSKADDEALKSQIQQGNQTAVPQKSFSESEQEWDIIRIILELGEKKYEAEQSVVEYILQEIDEHSIPFNNDLCARFIHETRDMLRDESFSPRRFFNHPDQKISERAIQLTFWQYDLSENWENMHGILIGRGVNGVQKDVDSALNRLKLKRVQALMTENAKKLREAKNEKEINKLLKAKIKLQEYQIELAKSLNSVILQ